MHTLKSSPTTFEFSFPDRDTLVLVEEADGRVLICATRDTFSERRKIDFIRKLAAEGFISEEYQWFAKPGQARAWPLEWRVDFGWLRLSEAAAARSRGFMTRLLCYGALLWFGLLGALWVHYSADGAQTPAARRAR